MCLVLVDVQYVKIFGLKTFFGTFSVLVRLFKCSWGTMNYGIDFVNTMQIYAVLSYATQFSFIMRNSCFACLYIINSEHLQA